MILKQYRFVVECTYTIRDLTRELVRSSLKNHPDYEDVMKDKVTWDNAERERRLLHGLLQDKEALEKFVRTQLACQIQDLALEVIAPQLEQEDSEEAILLPVIERMSTEDAGFFTSLIDADDCILDLMLDCFNLTLDQTTISEISN